MCSCLQDGPLRSLTSKREPSYSDGDVAVCPRPSWFPSTAPYDFADPGTICVHAPEMVFRVGMSEYTSVPFESILGDPACFRQILY